MRASVWTMTRHVRRHRQAALQWHAAPVNSEPTICIQGCRQLGMFAAAPWLVLPGKVGKVGPVVTAQLVGSCAALLADGKLATVFSSPCYPMHTPKDDQPFTNKGAVVHLTGPDYATPAVQQFEAVLPRPPVSAGGRSLSLPWQAVFRSMCAWQWAVWTGLGTHQGLPRQCHASEASACRLTDMLWRQTDQRLCNCRHCCSTSPMAHCQTVKQRRRVNCTTLPAAPVVVEQTRPQCQHALTQQPVQLQMQCQQGSSQGTQQQWLAWLTQAVLSSRL
jgi:hypothetical protein